MSMDDFWSIISQYPQIRTYKDLRIIVRSIEDNNQQQIFSQTYKFLKGFDKMIKQHIYEEFNLGDIDD